MAAGEERVLACRLPSKALWLNPIEPKWVTGQRAVAGPDRRRTVAEMTRRVYDYYRRVYDYYGCEPLPPLAQDVA